MANQRLRFCCWTRPPLVQSQQHPPFRTAFAHWVAILGNELVQYPAQNGLQWWSRGARSTGKLGLKELQQKLFVDLVERFLQIGSHRIGPLRTLVQIENPEHPTERRGRL
jgi:hypothetical protein